MSLAALRFQQAQLNTPKDSESHSLKIFRIIFNNGNIVPHNQKRKYILYIINISKYNFIKTEIICNLLYICN